MTVYNLQPLQPAAPTGRVGGWSRSIPHRADQALLGEVVGQPVVCGHLTQPGMGIATQVMAGQSSRRAAVYSNPSGKEKSNTSDCDAL